MNKTKIKIKILNYFFYLRKKKILKANIILCAKYNMPIIKHTNTSTCLTVSHPSNWSNVMAHKHDCFLFPCDGLRRKRQRNKRDRRDRKRKKGKEREEGRQVGFVLDGEFTRSVSVLPITFIRHWQKEHRLTLLRSTVQYVWDAKRTVAASRDRRLTANARGRIFSWPRNPQTLFHLLLTI